MAAHRNESYDRLQDLVKAWATEISEVRTQLDSSVTLRVSEDKPAFALREDTREDTGIVPVADSPSEDSSATTVSARMESELAFAREMLQALNAEVQEARARHSEALESVADANLKIETLEDQLRQKEWALRKAENERELLREDFDRIRLDRSGGMAEAKRDSANASQPALEALTAQLNETSSKLREAGHEIARLRHELAQRDEAAARVDALTEKYEDAVRTAEELRGVADSAQAELGALRESYELRMTQIREDYDALATSHMNAREAVADLQGKIVERDMQLDALRGEHADVAIQNDLSALRDELATYQTALQDAELRVSELNESRDALQIELDTVTAGAERAQIDHQLLVKALRDEIDVLRSVATEREFVSNHQQDAINAVERELATEKRIRAERETALGERDEMLEQMRAELAAHKERETHHVEEVGLLTARLDSKDAALLRARDRINLLRDLAKTRVHATVQHEGAKAESVQPSAPPDHAESPDVDRFTPVEEIDFSHWQPNAAVQREIEESTEIEFPWPVVVLAAIFAGGGLFITGLILLLFM